MDRPILVDDFYQILDLAKSKFSIKPLKKLKLTRKDIPSHGVYYFFDEEQRRENSNELKVIRIGTHAARQDSKATAYGRLNQHRSSWAFP